MQVVDNCGLVDVDTITVDVALNSGPIADAGADQTLLLCDEQEICWPVGCSDVDENLVDCIFTGPGLYDGTSICFTPTTSDVYTFVLEAIDDCGLSTTDTVQILVTLNSAPQVTLPSDFSEFLCTPTEICLDYTVADINGGALTEVMESGYGSIDTAANQICFTPTTAGDYEFVVRATDDCGVAGSDTVVVTVTFGETPAIACPTAPIGRIVVRRRGCVLPARYHTGRSNSHDFARNLQRRRTVFLRRHVGCLHRDGDCGSIVRGGYLPDDV